MIDTAERAETLGKYIVDHAATVRDTAKAFGISKSTVHTDVTERLRHTSPGLYGEVRKVLDLNKSERHIRGGNATKAKFRRNQNNTFPPRQKN
ncbi:MAG: sporulation transcriptional regulator SpoIIID [Clostridia bacterium]|nr:sporulation transcriptional regulator SpoIIID [Clostridia bacterium]